MRTCKACATETDESGKYCPDCGAALVEAASASSLVGLTIDGQFAIEAVLGGGAFGTVYRGRQLGLDRPVALKVPTHEIASDPVMARRFAREARSAARVHHPGVVAIYAVGELADGRPYLAMQLLDGEPLDRILVDGPLGPVRALRIARAIASALSDTHAADVVHRDLKPSNIMWRRDRNGDDRITLVDFGIAVCKPGTADATRLTANGLLGTPHYMSPEQAHGDEVDARADLYALGCVLFELVTGEPPFDGSGFEVLLAHMGHPAPVPSARNPDVPEAIDRLCGALLAKAPDDRPASADAVVALIDDALGEIAGTRPRSSSARRALRAPKRAEPGRDREGSTPTARVGLPLPRRRRAGRLLLGAVAAAIALAGFAAVELGKRRHAGGEVLDAGGEPVDTPDGPIDPRGANRREIYKDDGEVVLHVLVPDPLVAGHEIRSHLQVENQLGQPVVAPEIVLTVADGRVVKGLTARPHGGADELGHYDFRYAFPHAGHYVLRVFPPSVDSAFEIPLDVN